MIVVAVIGLLLLSPQAAASSASAPLDSAAERRTLVIPLRERISKAVSSHAPDRDLAEGIAADFAADEDLASTIEILFDRQTERLRAIVERTPEAAPPADDAWADRRLVVLAEREALAAAQEFREEMLAVVRTPQQHAIMLARLEAWSRRGWFRDGVGRWNHVGQGSDLAEFVWSDPTSRRLLASSRDAPVHLAAGSARLREILARYGQALDARIASARRVASDHLLAGSRLAVDDAGGRERRWLLALRERVLVSAEVWRFAGQVRAVIAESLGESAGAMWGERFLQRAAPAWFGTLTREESSIFGRCDIDVAIGAASGDVPSEVLALAQARWETNGVLYGLMDRALQRGEFIPCRDGSDTHRELIAASERLDRTVARLVGVRDAASLEVRWAESSFAE